MIKVSEFLVGKYRVCLRNEEKDLWAIVKKDSTGSVYNPTYNDFEYEPLPSNRNEQFLTQTRFSLKKALDIAVNLEMSKI